MTCPCGLTQEELDRHGGLGPGLICTAVWVDGSENVCGRPLGAHPHQQPPTLQGICPLIL